ncbi:hypothetical protein [Nafulsella turpanensis]|uniref:hypothetical protein n=1 Tax=Nafulsella turpanensis TaxID=1265690 RepID=UPI001F2A3FC8|nr:hypothetical protein [Nafulsella turpanensis]
MISSKGFAAGIPDPIKLVPTRLSVEPKTFFIASVVDERPDKQAVAWLFSGAEEVALKATDLAGGGGKALQDFMLQSLPRHKNLRPVRVRILECRIEEQPGEKEELAEGHIKVKLAFEQERDGETIPLTTYEGGLRYIRSVEHFAPLGPALQQSLSAALEYFNGWMEREKLNNIKLAKRVEVSFVDYPLKEEGDTVFYSPDRPLVWEDFKGKIRGGRYAAAVFPGIAYGGGSRVEDGIVHLELTARAYVIKNSSWVKDHARDAYGLNHEQRHFDIVQLAVEFFKQQVLAKKLTVEDYDGEIRYLYLEAYQEMNRLQEAYDGETGHGTNKAAQQRWDAYIDKELRRLGVKE